MSLAQGNARECHAPRTFGNRGAAISDKWIVLPLIVGSRFV